MILEISHPNDRREWKPVDEISSLEELPHHLRSPSFDWFHGLLVRVRDDDRVQYTGIFGKSECVDVSAGSKVMLNYFLPKYRIESRGFFADKSLVEGWDQCSNVEWLLTPMTIISDFSDRVVIPHRQSIRCLCAMARALLQGKSNRILEISEKWLDGEEIDESRVVAARRTGSTILESGIWFIAASCLKSDRTQCLHTAISSIGYAYDKNPDVDVLKIMHAQIPFYDIAQSITEMRLQ